MIWLFKEEPAHYSFADLEKDARTTWTGVRNALAQKHLRSVRKGDQVLFYHTGGEKAIVGLAEAATDAYADPDDPSGKSFVVDIVPVQRLDRPVALARIKGDGRFTGFPLVRMPRLSVMPVRDHEWRAIQSLAREP